MGRGEDVKMSGKSVWWGATALAVALLAGYALTQNRLLPRTNGASSVPVAAGRTTADTAPTDAMVNTVTSALANVSGLYDMAILPDGLGDNRFVVSAMVDVSGQNGAIPPSGTADTAMRSLVNAFFRDVYSLSEPISEAEITFTEDGTLVGTAGLGKDAYDSLATSTMNGDLASALASSPQRDASSANEEWLELKPEN